MPRKQRYGFGGGFGMGARRKRSRPGSVLMLLVLGLAMPLVLTACGTCQRSPELKGGVDYSATMLPLDAGQVMPFVRVLLRGHSGESATTWTIATSGPTRLIIADQSPWTIPSASVMSLEHAGTELVLRVVSAAAVEASGGLVPDTFGAGSMARATSFEFRPLSGEGTTRVGSNDYEGSLQVSVPYVKAGSSGGAQLGTPGNMLPVTFVNTVPMEAYVRGSLPSEMPASWHAEALKAQAVAIRTYTLFTILAASDSRREWDVDDTTAYLRYAGVSGEGGTLEARYVDAIRKAEAESRHEVMVYRGNLFKAYFHSTSGGQTTSTDIAFGEPAIPPLAGADLGSYGEASKFHRWTREYSVDAVSKAVSKAGVSGRGLGTVRRIRVADADDGGWVRRLVVEDSVGTIEVSAAALRRALGTGSDGLLSVNFDVSVSGNTVRFDGRGWGHGVGLDQWAANGMAKDGKTYRAILSAMYPGCEVLRLAAPKS